MDRKNNKKSPRPQSDRRLKIFLGGTEGDGEWYASQSTGFSPATAGKDYLSSAGAGGVDSAAGAATAAVGVAQPVQPVEATVPQLLQPVEQPLLQPVEQPVEQLLLQQLLLRRLKTRKLRLRPLLPQSLVPQAVPQLLQLLVATVPQPQSELAGT
jgi:hypothetical protein